jgi:origin recognition complex subunit 1
MAPQNLNGKAAALAVRKRRALPGISREDSDDELGSDDLPWEWIYNIEDPDRASDDAQNNRKRRKVTGNKIVGARMGTFECRIGDIVLLKADGSNEAWVAIICEFAEDDGEGEKAANFMWFTTEKEIRNKDKKRNDFYWVRSGPYSSNLLCEESMLSCPIRTSFTSPHRGISTLWHQSMAKPR